MVRLQTGVPPWGMSSQSMSLMRGSLRPMPVFRDLESESPRGECPVPPDIATCPDCLREMGPTEQEVPIPFHELPIAVPASPSLKTSPMTDP